jgi:hypothetical protein
MDMGMDIGNAKGKMKNVTLSGCATSGHGATCDVRAARFGTSFVSLFHFAFFIVHYTVIHRQ